MNLMSIVTVMSLILAIRDGIGMILMYRQYAQVIRGAIMTVKATKVGEVEIVEVNLLS
jgi:hypothetical protein